MISVRSSRTTYLCLKDDSYTGFYTDLSREEQSTTHLTVLCSISFPQINSNKVVKAPHPFFITICAASDSGGMEVFMKRNNLKSIILIFGAVFILGLIILMNSINLGDHEVSNIVKVNGGSMDSNTILIYLEQSITKFSNRKIEFNHLLTSATITKSGVVNLSGGRSERDNPNESIADYMENAEIYLNGMSINELKSLFNDYVIKVSWDKLGAGRVERIVHLNDFIEIK